MAVLDAAQATTARPPSRAFFSPALDFLCLGGGSLLLLPILTWAMPDTLHVSSLYWASLLAYVINDPHFAHSYEIFYRTFRAVVTDPNSDRKLFLRYMWAGVVAPILLVLFFAIALPIGDVRILGYAGNAMGFFVGWHYVKQGYGMLMVDAALRRSYFGNADKKILVVNSYACWILSWLVTNKVVVQRDFYGLSYAAIDTPPVLLWATAVVLVVTSIASAYILFRHARAHRGAIPINGIAAYIAALYPWLLMAREPVLGAFIPAMHSLQYLLIVWRYQLNVEHARPDAGDRFPRIKAFGFAPSRMTLRFGGFIARAIFFGFFGFVVFPKFFDNVVPFDHTLYGDYLFFFVLIIFINIHHYFIDNAMWRKENPHTLPHLFRRR